MNGRVTAMERWVRPAVVVIILVLGGMATTRSLATPQSWARYGELVTHQFQAWLMNDDDTALRLHKFLEDRARKADHGPVTVLIDVWINPDGQVIRVEVPTLGSPQADSDLRLLLTRAPLSEPPPPDMLQPLKLSLKFELNP